MRILSPAGDTSATWPGYAAAVWGLVFAVPSFVWGLGCTFGARSTAAPDLVRMAREQVPWFVATLWITGLLKLFGTFLGLGLIRPHGRRLGRFLTHPLVGDMTFNYETMQLTADDGLYLIVCGVAPGSRDAEALNLLASWNTPAPAELPPLP